MLRMIMCLECAKKVAEPGSPLYLAMFGPQGDPSQTRVLVSLPVQDLTFRLEPVIAEVMCDGECGQMLAVSRSSEWFLTQKKMLDGLPLN